jgi:diguanylate cyclase (GGDEF)-like protein
MFATFACVADALTAFLLVVQARSGRSLPLFLLACAYAYSAFAIVPHVLYFPGAFADRGLFGAGSQSAIWFWVWWHAGFPLIVLAYVVTNALPARHLRDVRLSSIYVAGGMFGVAALVAVLAIVTPLYENALPVLIRSGRYDRLISTGVGPAVLVAIGSALAALVFTTRLKTIAQLWLGVALFASFLDCALTLVGGGRFTMGWYAARFESLFGSTLVLLAFLRTIAVMFDRLATLSNVDGLTGLANRRSFDEHLIRQTSLTLRAGGSLSMLMLDVDHFKSYNDAYGHVAGDEALRAVARTLERALRRQTDFCARYGGEEFAILLPATNAPGAAHVAERIRASLARAVSARPGAAGPVTVSIGTSTMTAHEGRATRTAATLVASADRALYRAKAAGRNRVAVADVPLPMTLPDGRAVAVSGG